MLRAVQAEQQCSSHCYKLEMSATLHRKNLHARVSSSHDIYLASQVRKGIRVKGHGGRRKVNSFGGVDAG